VGRFLPALAVLCGLASPAAAQTADMLLMAATDFQLACLHTAPSLDAAAAEFTKAGFKRPHPALFVREYTPEMGLLAQSPDGRTRTCAVGLKDGDPTMLQAVIDHIASTEWPDATKMKRPGGDIAYVMKRDSYVETMTLSTKDPKLPVMNVVSFAPEGYGK
jgi:hypothetical protein